MKGGFYAQFRFAETPILRSTSAASESPRHPRVFPLTPAGQRTHNPRPFFAHKTSYGLDGMTTYQRHRRCYRAPLALASVLWMVCAGWSANSHNIFAEEIGRFPDAALRRERRGARSDSSQVSFSQSFDRVQLQIDEEILAPGEQPPPAASWPGSEAPAKLPREFKLSSHRSSCIAPPWIYGFMDSAGYVPHNDPDDPARHIGLGQPLVGTSWLNRPYYAAAMFGGMMADDAGIAELNNGFVAAVHLGYDFDHYYGGEVRIGGGQLGVADSFENYTDDLFMIDVRLLHYPWGDSLWRPYYSLGIGFAQHSLTDYFDDDYSQTLVNIPLGVGLKYQWTHCCAMRFDVTHNINIGSGVFDTMDNVSIMAGAEWHYGGQPKSYYPWNPSLQHH